MGVFLSGGKDELCPVVGFILIIERNFVAVESLNHMTNVYVVSFN